MLHNSVISTLISVVSQECCVLLLFHEDGKKIGILAFEYGIR